MLRILSLLIATLGAAGCQSTGALPAKALVNTQLNLDKGPHVDAGVRVHQNLWLKGLVLDPDQTGIHTLIVLGDSYSDTGNLFQKTRTLAPPQVYWRSRLSNGPIWVDYVQGATGWKIRNYAFTDLADGEARTTLPRSSLGRQIEQLERDSKRMDREGVLVSLWMGPDSYQEEGDQGAVADLIQEIREGIIALDSLGFHHIALGSLPDLSQQPQALSPQISTMHNEALSQMLEQLKKERLDLRAYLYQAHGVLKVSREKAESAGIKLQKEACYSGDLRGQTPGERRYCPKPGHASYWDFMHPSSKLHCFYAAQFLADTADAEHVGGYNKGQAVDHCQQL
jgi:phospholipase/lecithinase/hemolysin